jgi:hypothetical protein
MKIKLLAISIACVILSISCTKNSSSSGTASIIVSIRVENSTTENLSSVSLNATEFGALKSGETSKYFPCKNIVPIPFANIIAINNKIPYIADIVPISKRENIV